MGMVPASRKVEGGVVPPIRHKSRSSEGTADPRKGPVVHPLEHRILGIAETKAEICPRIIGFAELLETGKIFGRVEGFQIFTGRLTGGMAGNARKVEETVFFHELVGQKVPLDPEGMGVSEAIA